MTKREDVLLDEISRLIAENKELKAKLDLAERRGTCPMCEAATIDNLSVIEGICKWDADDCDPCAVCGGCVCTPE